MGAAGLRGGRRVVAARLALVRPSTPPRAACRGGGHRVLSWLPVGRPAVWRLDLCHGPRGGDTPSSWRAARGGTGATHGARAPSTLRMRLRRFVDAARSARRNVCVCAFVTRRRMPNGSSRPRTLRRSSSWPWLTRRRGRRRRPRSMRERCAPCPHHPPYSASDSGGSRGRLRDGAWCGVRGGSRLLPAGGRRAPQKRRRAPSFVALVALTHPVLARVLRPAAGLVCPRPRFVPTQASHRDCGQPLVRPHYSRSHRRELHHDDGLQRARPQIDDRGTPQRL